MPQSYDSRPKPNTEAGRRIVQEPEPISSESDEGQATAATLESLQWALAELADKSTELRQAHAARQAIQQLSATLLVQTSVKALAQQLLRGLSSLVGAAQGSVLLLDDAASSFVVVADVGLPEDARQSGVPANDSISATVLHAGEPLLLSGRSSLQRREQRRVGSALIIPVSVAGRPVGVVNLNRLPGEGEFHPTDLELAATVVSTFSAMFESLKTRERQQHLILSTIKALALAIEAKDPYTHGHCERVAMHARGIAEQLGADETFLDEVSMGATLHDIGKIGVPEHVLLKPGRLTKEEFEHIKRHPTVGADIIAPVGLPAATVDAVRHHHERVDGGGYPSGLAGEAIPLAARIVAVADAFDAMTITRPYRDAVSAEAAMDELRRCAGSQFDVRIVAAFVAYCAKGEHKLASFAAARAKAKGLQREKLPEEAKVRG